MHLGRCLIAGDVNLFQTALSYVASNGPLELLELILQLPGLDPNKPDNEGNTPLHFAAQAGEKTVFKKTNALFMHISISHCQILA